LPWSNTPARRHHRFNAGAVSAAPHAFQQPLLLYNFIAIEQNVAQVSSEPDIIYALVLARTRGRAQATPSSWDAA
jgi:hypothetical protein